MPDRLLELSSNLKCIPRVNKGRKFLRKISLFAGQVGDLRLFQIEHEVLTNHPESVFQVQFDPLPPQSGNGFHPVAQCNDLPLVALPHKIGELIKMKTVHLLVLQQLQGGGEISAGTAYHVINQARVFREQVQQSLPDTLCIQWWYLDFLCPAEDGGQD